MPTFGSMWRPSKAGECLSRWLSNENLRVTNAQLLSVEDILGFLKACRR
jgi:hypothetical protein